MKAKFLLVVVPILIFQISTHAQNPEKKETYKSLKSRSSTTDVGLLLADAENLKDKNPGEALTKVQEALGVSLAQKDQANEGRCYLLLGEINESIEEWNLALENYLRAYQKLNPKTDSALEPKRILKGLGTTSLKLQKYEDALRYFNEGLNMRSRNSDRTEWLLSISEVYYQMENYDKALEVINISPSKISQGSADSRLQNQQAKIYARKNEVEKTKDLYANSLNTLRSTKNVDAEDSKSLQEAKEEITDALHDQKKYDDEIEIRNKSIEYNLESNNLSEVAKDKVAISKSLAAKGETSAAILQMEEAAALADTLNDPKEQAQAFLALANLYEQNGRREQALSTYKRYSEAIQNSEKVDHDQRQEKSELLKQQKDIEALTKDVSIGQYEESATVFQQRVIIYGLVFVILVSAVISYLIYKNAQAGKAANQLLALKSLRSQMNPHFIFNALNSVNHFIAQQDERTANKFLSEFSQLMRLVLEYSQEDFISLQKEYEILALYVKLEHYRFRDKFDYEFIMDESVNAEVIEVPPMLIQPYIENAVWHGLRYKESKGKLRLEFRSAEDNLIVKITDDGIGRKKSAVLKTVNQKKHNSTGLKNIQERLTIINKVYKAKYKVSIKDLDQDQGTEVEIIFPIKNRKEIA